jgi:cell division protein FtsQ
VGALLLLVLAASPWWVPPTLSRLAFFRVRRVEVRGTRYIPPSDILDLLAVDTTASVWDPAEPLEARVRAHREVRAVRVRRRLPGTLVVTVVERAPIALVPAADGFRVYDAEGHALPIDLARTPVDAPILSLRDSSLLAFLGRLRGELPELYQRVSELRRVGREEVVVRLDSVPVRARPDLEPARLYEVIPVERDLARRGQRVEEIDLRFRDQVIARVQ